ncbi:MAG: hypothetical protein JAZ17_11000 [Candidatus Thiodiazotropha endolucinida]|nr:hypothetical protein [Candidatus Thiodiazotropha endolucinida]
MKRKDKSSHFNNLKHRFPPTILYRTDINQIVEMMSDRGLDVKISDEDYEYESLDEVQEQKGNRVYKLNIDADKDNSIYKSMYLLIEKDGITLQSHKDDHLIPLWYEIKELISKRTPWYARFMSPFGWASAAFVWLLFGPKADEISNLQQSMALAWLVVLTLFLLVSFFSSYYRRTNRGIYLQKQHEVLGFWQRNGDKIFMLAIGTVLGVAGTAITNLITINYP